MRFCRWCVSLSLAIGAFAGLNAFALAGATAPPTAGHIALLPFDLMHDAVRDPARINPSLPEISTTQSQNTASAPLPPSLLAGAVGLTFAGLVAYRIRRRGGRI